jgi:8-oxo-dGTP pyrophosphatase MutT (NUDIX family)
VQSDPRHGQLRALLAQRAPVDQREADAIPRILTELERLPAPFDLDADPTHVTASAVVVGPRGTLLLLHKRIGLWVQPGGHLDPGEDLAAAALREAEEETGLTLAHPRGGPIVVNVDVHPGGRGHTHLDVRYLLHAGADDPRPPPEESQQVAWFDWDAALAIADPALVGTLRALRPELEDKVHSEVARGQRAGDTPR